MNAKQPKIGHVLHSLVVAGAETLVHGMVKSMHERYRFSAYLLDDIGPLGEDLRADGVPVTVLGRKEGVDLGLARRLGKMLRDDGVDLIHCHQYTPWFYGTLGAAAGWKRPRVLFTEHGRHYPDQRRPKRIAFNRLLAPMTDGMVAVSGFIRDCLIENEGLDPRRVEVLYNGIEPDQFDIQVDRAALRQEQGIGIDDPVVGIAARFAPVKDHATLLKAFRHVLDRLPNAKLVFAGDGPLRAELEAQTRELELGEAVRFLGVRRDVPQLLQTWDVFTLSSLSEGTSVTLLEAMAAGLPAVATAVGGNPEIVAEGETGLLAPRGDAERLGDALHTLLADPQRARAMGAVGRQRVRESFTFSGMVEGYDRLYQQLLRGSPS